jgi:ABC-type long-subunit fatty acid transport system fused permease/ATPase subunit
VSENDLFAFFENPTNLVLCGVVWALGVAIGLVAMGATNCFGMQSETTLGPDRETATAIVLFWPATVLFFASRGVLVGVAFCLHWAALNAWSFFFNLGVRLRARAAEEAQS